MCLKINAKTTYGLNSLPPFEHSPSTLTLSIGHLFGNVSQRVEMIDSLFKRVSETANEDPY